MPNLVQPLSHSYFDWDFARRCKIISAGRLMARTSDFDSRLRGWAQKVSSQPAHNCALNCLYLFCLRIVKKERLSCFQHLFIGIDSWQFCEGTGLTIFFNRTIRLLFRTCCFYQNHCPMLTTIASSFSPSQVLYFEPLHSSHLLGENQSDCSQVTWI